MLGRYADLPNTIPCYRRLATLVIPPYFDSRAMLGGFFDLSNTIPCYRCPLNQSMITPLS